MQQSTKLNLRMHEALFTLVVIAFVTALSGSARAQRGETSSLPQAPTHDTAPQVAGSNDGAAHASSAENRDQAPPEEYPTWGELSLGLRVSQPVLHGEEPFLIPRGELSFRVFGPLFVGAYIETYPETFEGFQVGALVRARHSFRLDRFSRFFVSLDVYGGYSSVDVSDAQEEGGNPFETGGELGSWFGVGLDLGKGTAARGTVGLRAGYVRRFGMDETLVTPGSLQGLVTAGWRF